MTSILKSTMVSSSTVRGAGGTRVISYDRPGHASPPQGRSLVTPRARGPSRAETRLAARSAKGSASLCCAAGPRPDDCVALFLRGIEDRAVIAGRLVADTQPGADDP